jgi:serine/threonine protein kinase
MTVSRLQERWDKYVTYGLSVQDQIGAGSFGAVYRGKLLPYQGRTLRWTPGPVAIKRLSFGSIVSRQSEVLKEVELMAKIAHPACLQILAWTPNDRGYAGIATPLMPSVLSDRLYTATIHPASLTPVFCSITALGVASGLAYLHSQDMVHCDIKPDNILFDSKNRPFIADFGLCRLITDQDSQNTQSNGDAERLWAAPELRNGDITSAVDVYSFGRMLGELLAPTDRNKQTSLAKSGKLLELPPRSPERLVRLIGRCLSHNPTERPSFREILEDRGSLMFSAGEAEAAAVEEYWAYLNADAS